MYLLRYVGPYVYALHLIAKPLYCMKAAVCLCNISQPQCVSLGIQE